MPVSYRVKVRMTSTAGQSLALELEEFDDDINEPRKRFAPGDAVTIDQVGRPSSGTRYASTAGRTCTRRPVPYSTTPSDVANSV